MVGEAGRRRKFKAPKPENRVIAEWMTRELKKTGWTDEEAADRCSELGEPHTVSATSIFNYRHGLESISRAKIKPIAHGFRINEEDLVRMIGLLGGNGDATERELTPLDYIVQAQVALDYARSMLDERQSASS